MSSSEVEHHEAWTGIDDKESGGIWQYMGFHLRFKWRSRERKEILRWDGVGSGLRPTLPRNISSALTRSARKSGSCFCRGEGIYAWAGAPRAGAEGRLGVVAS